MSEKFSQKMFRIFLVTLILSIILSFDAIEIQIHNIFLNTKNDRDISIDTVGTRQRATSRPQFSKKPLVEVSRYSEENPTHWVIPPKNGKVI